MHSVPQTASHVEPFALSSAPIPADRDVRWRLRPLARFVRRDRWDEAAYRKVAMTVFRFFDVKDFGMLAEEDLTDHGLNPAETALVEAYLQLVEDYRAITRRPQILPVEANPANVAPLSPVSKPKPIKPKAPARPKAPTAAQRFAEILETARRIADERGTADAFHYASTRFSAFNTGLKASMGRLMGSAWTNYVHTFPNDPARRFGEAIVACLIGSPVVFPDPDAPEAPDFADDATTGQPGALPDAPKGWDAIEADDPARVFPCHVCGRDMGWDRPSGVCSSECLKRGQGFPIDSATVSGGSPGEVRLDRVEDLPDAELIDDDGPDDDGPGGIPECTDPAIDSALRARARLARADGRGPQSSAPHDALEDLTADEVIGRVVSCGVDTSDPWLDRFAVWFSREIISTVTQLRDIRAGRSYPWQSDNAYWPWFGLGRASREDFGRWCDRLGFMTWEGDGYSRYVTLANLCLDGSPVSFPKPSKPTDPGDKPGEAPGRPAERSSAPDAPTMNRDSSDAATAVLVILAHGPDQPVIRFDTSSAPHAESSAPITAPHEAVSAPHEAPRVDFPQPRRIIRIKGANYGMVVHPEGIELTSPEGATHYVIDGECSCRDAFYRGRACKHRRALEEIGLIPTYTNKADSGMMSGHGSSDPVPTPDTTTFEESSCPPHSLPPARDSATSPTSKATESAIAEKSIPAETGSEVPPTAGGRSRSTEGPTEPGTSWSACAQAPEGGSCSDTCIGWSLRRSLGLVRRGWSPATTTGTPRTTTSPTSDGTPKLRTSKTSSGTGDALTRSGESGNGCVHRTSPKSGGCGPMGTPQRKSESGFAPAQTTSARSPSGTDGPTSPDLIASLAEAGILPPVMPLPESGPPDWADELTVARFFGMLP